MEAMDNIKAQLQEFSLWQLVQLIISIALELQARLNNMPREQRQSMEPAPVQRPSVPLEPASEPAPSSSGSNKGKGKSGPSYTENYDSNKGKGKSGPSYTENYDSNKGKGKSGPSYTEDYDDSNVVCDGHCVICRRDCIRLKPYHKNCKCRRHLHYR